MLNYIQFFFLHIILWLILIDGRSVASFRHHCRFPYILALWRTPSLCYPLSPISDAQFYEFLRYSIWNWGSWICVGTQIRMDFLPYIFQIPVLGCFLLAPGLAHGWSHRAGSITKFGQAVKLKATHSSLVTQFLLFFFFYSIRALRKYRVTLRSVGR